MATMSARYTVIDGEVIAQERSGVRHQLVPDSLGSTVALYDNAGTKTDTFGYWPNGEASSRTGNTTAKFQYVGTLGYYQDKVRLNYVRARFLDSDKGRWIIEDRVGFYSGDYNLYRYVKNQIMSSIDPTGNWPENAHYGRYCGPQDKYPVDKNGKPLPPKDDLDTCCFKHDECFAGYKCTALNQSINPGCARCNSSLCKCLIENVNNCGILGIADTPKCAVRRVAICYACNIFDNWDQPFPVIR